MKTVAGQQLLKDKIAVTLPIKMTPDEVKKLSADTSKGEYNDAENMWYFYDATYEITNNVINAAYPRYAYHLYVWARDHLFLLCLYIPKTKKFP